MKCDISLTCQKGYYADNISSYQVCIVLLFDKDKTGVNYDVQILVNIIIIIINTNIYKYYEKYVSANKTPQLLLYCICSCRIIDCVEFGES